MESTSIYAEYLQLTKQYQTKYGKSTIVLLQVGAFFEVYGFLSSKESSLDTQIQEFSQICSLNISEKKATFENRQVIIAGFRDYTLDKYIQRLSENGYTSVVYVQEKTGKTITRVLDTIHSPGTYLSQEIETNVLTNNIACIWMDTFTKKTIKTMVCGIAIANIFTGKSFLTEFQEPFLIQPTTFDDLERIITIHAPSEVVFIYNSSFDNESVKSILQFSGLSNCARIIHKVSVESSEKATNCMQQKYVDHILSTFYGAKSMNGCQELQMYPTATQAFCYLLDFVQEHNPNLVRNIEIPRFQTTSNVILANHTLKQLNILNPDSNAINSSVASFLNRCQSAMGKRIFHAQLVSPTTDTVWLNQEYAATRNMLESDNYEMVVPLRKLLGQVCDIEKICRQLVVRKLVPSSIAQLYKSIGIAQQLWTCLGENTKIQQHLTQDSIEIMCSTLIQFLDTHLWINRCSSVSSLSSFEESIVKPGVCEQLDKALTLYQNNQTLFAKIHSGLNEAIRINEQGTGTGTGKEVEYVKIHETEKSGLTLQITKKRGLILKKIAQNKGSSTILDIPGTSWTDFRLVTASSNADEIVFPLLTTICNELLYQKESLNKWIAFAYNEVLRNLENDYYPILESVAQFLGKTDVLMTKTFIAKEYHYCCPKIEEETQEKSKVKPSFVQANGLRHVIIEQIHTKEIYVANDIGLGIDPISGILLYGTNAVGKTSLIRALGIAVIMAQAGLFVPCTSFVYKPYTAIFSRILGNDDLFKGLSTFAVEMSELRVILKMADQNSLILGDELCSGTETESALSIFVAGLMDLHQKQSSFIFATHFHEIIRYNEIQEMSQLALKHMSVSYDRESDKLIYDRTLKDGAGNRMYGLEVCKSLHLPEEFLEKAFEIRRKYFPETKGELSHPVSRYNAAKIRGNCEMCFLELGSEVHHIHPQRDADPKTGIIKIKSKTNDKTNNKTNDKINDKSSKIFHKNHPANLMSICEKCHLKIHKIESNSNN